MRPVIKVLAIVLVMALILCSVACTEKKEDTPPQIQIIDHDLTIHEFGGDVLKSIAAVEGRAKNTSNLMLNSVYISVNFYDKDGNLLQTASSSKQNWEAGEIWNFNVQFTSPDAWKTVRYDISVSTEQ